MRKIINRKIPFHVVIITNSTGFPNGMAATQRIRLLSKALVENGTKVSIFCLRAIENDPVINIESNGIFEGIQFNYTPGTTLRANRFLARRWLELKGDFVALFSIWKLKKNQKLDCIYLWGTSFDLTLWGLVFRSFIKILGIPLVLEINERPWSLKENPNFFEKHISPLFAASGVISISEFIYEWVGAEAHRISRDISNIKIPVVVDVNENNENLRLENNCSSSVVFAGSPVYDQTITFIIKAMGFVWQTHPECKLVITGCKKTDQLHNKILNLVSIGNHTGNISFLGYLARPELLNLYTSANALLIPLFNDVRSKARFPTKIGEYLLSGRPVISNNIGEVGHLFSNKINILLSENENSKDFAKLIVLSLENTELSNKIGKNGALKAKELFDYQIWGKPLSTYFRSIVKV
jgi:glycosyltransferase involved in cell wall biosynthesis